MSLLIYLFAQIAGRKYRIEAPLKDCFVCVAAIKHWFEVRISIGMTMVEGKHPSFRITYMA